MIAVKYISHAAIRYSRVLPVWAYVRHFLFRLTARLLLFGYVLLILKPVMPILTDSIAHTFWKSVHIAVVHKINGKEHVHYELCRDVRENDKNKAGLKSKSGTEEIACTIITGPLQTEMARRIFLSRPVSIVIPPRYADAEKLLIYPPPKC